MKYENAMYQEFFSKKKERLIMKCIILAGGMQSTLAHGNEAIPKPMIEEERMLEFYQRGNGGSKAVYAWQC